MPQPILRHGSVILRPFTLDDAETVAAIANDPTIYAKTLLLPFPYGLRDAVNWISTHEVRYESGGGMDWAVTLEGDSTPIGSIGLAFTPERDSASLGFWIAAGHRGRGYCTDAGLAVVDFAMNDRKLARLTSFHFVGNEKSGRVLRKIGMTCTGISAGFVLKDGLPVDCVCYVLEGGTGRG